LACKGIVLDAIGSETEHCISFSNVNRKGVIVHASENFYEDYPLVEDQTLRNSLIDTLLLGHSDRSGPYPTFLASPWIENHGEDDTENDMRLDPEKRKSLEVFWTTVQFEGYFVAFDKFRKDNSTFKIRGHDLRSFFPKWKPDIGGYSPGMAGKDALDK
jgi:hypothetical protein